MSRGFHTLAICFSRPRYIRLPTRSAIASMWLTSAFASSALAFRPCNTPLGLDDVPDDVLFTC